MHSMVAKGVLRPSWQLERGSRHGAVRHTSWCVNGEAMALRCFVFESRVLAGDGWLGSAA